jgi:hypothetical protein
MGDRHVDLLFTFGVGDFPSRKPLIERGQNGVSASVSTGTPADLYSVPSCSAGPGVLPPISALSERYRCSGTNRSLATIVQLPVPRNPVTFQSSLMVTSRLGTRRSASSTTSARSLRMAAPRNSHCAYWLPDPNGQTPLSM